MARDLTLYPRKATRSQLKTYLEELGFRRCKHWWDWPAGTLNYSWFDSTDFRSVDGVSADVYPIEAEKGASSRVWALHVRNLYGASWHDVKMLNDVLRGARKRFGGTIKGDYGVNRYAPLWDDESTPISRGTAAIYQHVHGALKSVRAALPESTIQDLRMSSGDKKSRELAEFMRSLDPVRTLYNGLVPFAVAMFEYFFSRVFRVLVAYDPRALERRKAQKLRIEFDSLLQVSAGESTVEDIIMQAYTFQNLDQLNKAYKEWLNIDVRHLLYKRKRIGRTVTFLESRLASIIEYRHGIIHHFELDPSLSREGYLSMLDAIEVSINEFASFLETRYGFRLQRY